MSDKVKKEILMMYELAGDKKLTYYDAIQNIIDYIAELEKENSLLKEELKELKDGITGIYNNMNALEIINKHEMENIEEL